MSSEPSRAPLVSVIILSWNCRDFLPRVVASVTRQAYPAVEVVIVDDDALVHGAERHVVSVALHELEQPVTEGLLAAEAGAESVCDGRDQPIARPNVVQLAGGPLEWHPHRPARRQTPRLHPPQREIKRVGTARLEARRQGVEHAVGSPPVNHLAVRAMAARHAAERLVRRDDLGQLAVRRDHRLRLGRPIAIRPVH